MTAREVHIFRADGQVEPVLIRIEREMPQLDHGQAITEQANSIFQADAKAIADALWESCPGGTISALLVELLQRRASHFRVTFPQEATR